MEVENSPFGDKPHIFQDSIFHETMIMGGSEYFHDSILSGQIIATSNDLSPKSAAELLNGNPLILKLRNPGEGEVFFNLARIFST